MAGQCFTINPPVMGGALELLPVHGCRVMCVCWCSSCSSSCRQLAVCPSLTAGSVALDARWCVYNLQLNKVRGLNADDLCGGAHGS